MVYGIVALSLTFLAHYGGFVSLAQMMVAGVAGYTIAVMVPDAIPANACSLPYALAIPLALARRDDRRRSSIGAIAVRTREIYLLMITLAIAVGFYFFVQSNIECLNGYEGIRNILGPDMFGVPFRNTTSSTTSTLGVAARALWRVLYLVQDARSGSCCRASATIRAGSRRSATMSPCTASPPSASPASSPAAAASSSRSTTSASRPGQISTHATINILIMAVIGGLGHPIGAFIGALIFTLVDTFAATIYDRDRFNTLIGLVFLVIVLASPDGVVGLANGSRTGDRLRCAAPSAATRMDTAIRTPSGRVEAAPDLGLPASVQTNPRQ